MVQALVLELDVLVDLSPLSSARRRGDWRRAALALPEVEAWPASAGDLSPAELIEWAGELGARVGVLTDLPAPLAEPLGERLGLSGTTFLDASAGLQAAPSPEALLAVCGRLATPPGEALFLARGWPAFHAAAQAGAVSVGAGWCGDPVVDRLPDIWAERPEQVIEALEDPASMGPLGEAMLGGAEPRVHPGSLIALPGAGRACGRYLSATDRRLSRHRLSALILAAKERPAAAELLGSVLAAGAAAAEGDVDLVASIPVGTVGGFDRFAAARGAVAAATGAEAADLIEMTTAVEGYTSLDRDRRRMVNEGRFRARRVLDGESVLLLDDVYTSGSQSRACARALGAGGAGEVRVVVAGVSQEPVGRPCPRCGEGVMRRIYGERGPFYGCTNFHCDHAERWDG
jgi:hypothetical protein